MDRKDLLDTLEFYDNGIRYEYVNAVSAVKLNTFVFDRKLNLPQKG